MHQKNILLTGPPGIGKTTVIEKTAQLLGKRVKGFYTAEIREGRQRRGFEIITLDGKKSVLAHVDFNDSKYRVGKYGVRPDNLKDTIHELLWTINNEKSACILIDEIGKMELFAPGFEEMILAAFNSDLPVIATIQAKPHPFCDSFKKRPDVKLIKVSTQNRDTLPERLYNLVKPLLQE